MPRRRKGRRRVDDRFERRPANLRLARVDGSRLARAFRERGSVGTGNPLDARRVVRRVFPGGRFGDAPIAFRNKTRSAAIFFELFERSRDVSTFAKSDALRLIAALDRKYAEATRAGVVRDVSRVFSQAAETQLLDLSQFKIVERGSFKNKSRETFVDRATYSRLLEASSDQETRTLIALYRIGGLRKSEALCVEWRDVDFATGRMLIHSPKTAGCGRPSRIIPLFPELRAELEAFWDLVPEGESRYVIARNRNPNTLRKRIERVVFYAGLPLWERLIQNMRSSRANEIFRVFGQIAERERIDRSTATAQDRRLHILGSGVRPRRRNASAQRIERSSDDARRKNKRATDGNHFCKFQKRLRNRLRC